MDCSLPGSTVHRILQARMLEWVAIPFSRGSSQPRDGTQVSRIASRLLTVTKSHSCDLHGLQPPRLLHPWDSPGKNTGVGSHFLLPGDLPDPGIEPMSLVLQEDSLLLSHQGSPIIRALFTMSVTSLITL